MQRELQDLREQPGQQALRDYKVYRELPEQLVRQARRALKVHKDYRDRLVPQELLVQLALKVRLAR